MRHDILIINIKGLVQVRHTTPKFLAGVAMAELPILTDAYLLIENDLIKDYGAMRDLPTGINANQTIDASG